MKLATVWQGPNGPIAEAYVQGGTAHTNKKSEFEFNLSRKDTNHKNCPRSVAIVVIGKCYSLNVRI